VTHPRRVLANWFGAVTYRSSGRSPVFLAILAIILGPLYLTECLLIGPKENAA
jgi:hypothetical protein